MIYHPLHAFDFVRVVVEVNGHGGDAKGGRLVAHHPKEDFGVHELVDVKDSHLEGDVGP